MPYTLEAGRLFVKDGRPLAAMAGAASGYDPTEVDALAAMQLHGYGGYRYSIVR
jgi:hypothetical protein